MGLNSVQVTPPSGASQLEGEVSRTNKQLTDKTETAIAKQTAPLSSGDGTSGRAALISEATSRKSGGAV